MFDATAYTEWRDCEGNVICKEEDVVKVELKSGEIVCGEIQELNGDEMTLNSELLGDLGIDISDINSLSIEDKGGWF